jgi:excisionase family DNA binding protein
VSSPDITPSPRESQPARRLLSVDDVAEWLGLTRPATYRLVRQGRLPCVAVGRYYRFDPSAIQRWIDSGGAE